MHGLRCSDFSHNTCHSKRRHTRMKIQRVLRRLVLLGTPLALGLLELWHPVPVPGMRFETIARYNDWWLILHLLQLPLFGLMALAVMVLVAHAHGRSATIARVGMGF